MTERSGRPPAELRDELPGEAATIADLHKEAFGPGAHGDAVSSLVLDLSSSILDADRLSLVAMLDESIVGHVLFTRGLLDAPHRLVGIRVLSPVAVRRAHRGRGIGSALIRRGIEVLADNNVPAVFLEGDPAYYARFGFVAGGPVGFRKPSLRIPDPAFQVLRLPAYAEWMTGTVVYNEAFWRHDLVGLREAGRD